MQNNEILEQFSQLTDFQKERLTSEILDFIQFNQFVQNTHYSVCPVCGVNEPRIIKKGFLGGKQRVQCKECGHKFVTTCGRLNYNSQQTEERCSIVIADILNVIPLHATAAQIDCSEEDTVFHMRHKFLLLLEQLLFEQSEVMEGIVEIDEPTSRIVLKGSSEQKDEKMCVLMGTNRMGKEVAQCVNRIRPSSEEVIEVFGATIKEKSMLANDGLFLNYELIKQNHLTSMIVSDHHEFTDVLHLNTVNNMHSGFKTLYRYYCGVSSKYLNRYLTLYVFMRRFTGIDNQEKLMVFLQKTKGFMISLTNKSVKTQNLLMV